jgi:hypothetical protein
LKHDEGLAFSGRVRHERNDVTVIEIKNANLSSFRPTSETSQDRSLLAQSEFCVTSRVKVKKEKFDVIVEQVLSCFILEPSYSHYDLSISGSGMLASLKRPYELCRVTDYRKAHRNARTINRAA